MDCLSVEGEPVLFLLVPLEGPLSASFNLFEASCRIAKVSLLILLAGMGVPVVAVLKAVSLSTSRWLMPRIRDCIDNESKDIPSDQSGCPQDNTTVAKDTQPDLSDFFNNLWPEDQESTRRDPTPKTCTVTTMTMHSRTQISISTQTDICDLPPQKTVTHTGCNTTPKFVRDKTTQHAPSLIPMGISPHCVFIDDPPMNNWEEDSSPPGTPDLDIPSYFTEDFQLKREE